MIRYHDTEWGVPVHDDRLLFEYLILEGAQAGLSWNTVLKKRENYRAAFDNFVAEKIVRYGDKKVAELLGNSGIIRNRLKVDSAVSNAKAFLELQAGRGSFDRYLWDWVDGAPIVNRWRSKAQVPATTELSDKIGKDLSKRGFRFVGATIVYAYLQAVGVVNDHLVGCHCHPLQRA